ncbi:MAG TPA: hypothetical protein VKM55_03830 [Candidatus Lokiarchaeia archaeon]|nr:hypothetical protein [Candidatus Lokiarchaeia archaeon]
MTLLEKTIQALRDRPESDALSMASALQHVLDVLFQLEKSETDPDILRDLSADSIRICDELKEVMQVLEEKMGAVSD